MTTKKEIRKDLYTVSQYAKKLSISTTAVYKMIKEQRCNTVLINGATLIKG